MSTTLSHKKLSMTLPAGLSSTSQRERMVAWRSKHLIMVGVVIVRTFLYVPTILQSPIFCKTLTMLSRHANAARDVRRVSHLSVFIVLHSTCRTGIDSPSCKEGNLVSSKTGALIVLKAILGRPIDVDLIPEYPLEVNMTHNTVIEAPAVRTAENIKVETA